MAGLLTEPPRGADGSAGLREALVVVAHRGPVRYGLRGDHLVERRSGGGLVTALRDVARNTRSMRWICAAATPEDRIVAERGTWRRVRFGDDVSCLVNMLAIDEPVHHDFYAVVANPLLWFIQHNLWDHGIAPNIERREIDAWSNGYVAVNRRFASEIAKLDNVPVGSVVMVHDYHFYLVPEMVRSVRPDLFVHHFTHIPWPQPDAWRVLPPEMREAIFRGLLGSDIVGFHTTRYVRNFLLGCEELLGAEVDYATSTVRHDGRTVAVRHYPISVDPGSLEALQARAEVRAARASLESTRSEKLVLRVDRTDPSKNIVRGFRAYERMLEDHPELHGRVQFLALLQPSRQDVPQYARYLRAINSSVAEVNMRFGTATWKPIDLRLADDIFAAIAAYEIFDVLMVNPVFDGMNLVAKEALLVNESDGVVALSENAGAHAELGGIAVGLHPFDIEQQANALYECLVMPRTERRARREVGAEIVRANDVQKWLQRQLADINARRGTPVH